MEKGPLFVSLAVELVCSQVYHFLPLIFQYFHCSPHYTSPIIQQSWSMWNRDGFRASWLNHTPAEAQRLQDNCWSVKVESCGATVLRSYDSRFLWWGSFVFLLNDLLILPQAEPPNNYSQTIYLAWNLILTWKKSHHRKYVDASFYFSFQYSPSFSLLLPFFPQLSLNLKSKICLNWLQRAWGGFVSTVMRVLIGPEAQAANRPLVSVSEPFACSLVRWTHLLIGVTSPRLPVWNSGRCGWGGGLNKNMSEE